jgi:hypothetical protein
MSNLIITYWIVFMIIGTFSILSTKWFLKKKGISVSFLNNEIEEMKELLSLIKTESSPKTKKILKILFCLNIFTLLGFVGWIIMIVFDFFS